uniref:Uncharacterized protein n=1 Tax=Arundo donax TaxID=35708 RepID=A0A0A9HWE4_ARUDO
MEIWFLQRWLWVTLAFFRSMHCWFTCG